MYLWFCHSLLLVSVVISVTVICALLRLNQLQSCSFIFGAIFYRCLFVSLVRPVAVFCVYFSVGPGSGFRDSNEHQIIFELER